MNHLLRQKISYLAWITFLTFSSIARAEDIYIAQTSQGTGTGSSATTAKAISFFNNSGNWSSPKSNGKIGPGDVVHLVGTFTSALIVQDSGTAGKAITIVFELNAKISMPALPTSGAIVVNAKHYITVDGGSNGLIESTDNGTNLGNKVDSTAIAANDANYLTVKNLTIRNVYVRVAGPEQNGYGSAIQQIGTWTDWTVQNCNITHCYIAGNGRYTGTCANAVWANNTVTYCNWGFRAGDANSSSRLTGVTAYGNNISKFANWDDTVNNSFHHNGFYCWAESGGVLRSLTFYNNTLGPTWGVHTTGGIFLSGDFGTVLVNNNLFLATTGADDAPSNGLLTIWPHHGAGTGYRVYNNTFIGGGVGRAIHLIEGNGKSLTTFDIKNNIVVNMGTMVAQFVSGSASLVADYNVGYDLTAGQEFSVSSNTSAGFLTFSNWKLLGLDANGSTSDPKLDTSYHPQVSSTTVLNKGVNLSGFFNTDKDSAGRPSTGLWTVGAYQGPTASGYGIPPSNALITVTLP